MIDSKRVRADTYVVGGLRDTVPDSAYGVYKSEAKSPENGPRMAE